MSAQLKLKPQPHAQNQMSQAETLLDILRKFNRPMGRKELFDAMQDRGHLTDYSIKEGKNAVSTILSKAKSEGRVIVAGTDTENGGMLWTLPELAGESSAAQNADAARPAGDSEPDRAPGYSGPEASQEITESSQSAATAEAATLDSPAYLSAFANSISLPELSPSDTGIRTVIEFETPDGRRHPNLESARAALAEARLRRQIDQHLEELNLPHRSLGLFRAVIKRWEGWKAGQAQ